MAVTGSADIILLATILEAGSLSAAGRRLSLSPASISGRLTELERRLGVVLLRRTSRSLRVTAEGAAYLAATRSIPAMLEAAEDAARAAIDPRGAIAGPVRLGAPVDLGRQYVAGMVDRFSTEHPRVTVELILSDEVVDLAAQDLDLTIRYGEMPDASGITASLLARNRRVVCGAPGYLDRRGRPRRPAELAAHNCLCLRTARDVLDQWPVGRVRVAVAGDRSSNDGMVLRDWARRGMGLVLKSWWDVRQDVAAGRLETLFGDLPPVPHALRLVRPTGRDVPARVRAMADHLRASFREIGMAQGADDLAAR